MARTNSNVLWTLFYPDGRFTSLRLVLEQRPCLPLFSSGSRAQAWADEMNLSWLVPSIPLWPATLRDVLKAARKAGFELTALDPAPTPMVPVQTMSVDEMSAQAQAKLEAKT